METPISTGRSKQNSSREFSKKLFTLAAAGCAAFWIADFLMAISPIAAKYKAAFSISTLPVALAEALIGGLVIALCISFFLLRFFNRITTQNPIIKALILSFSAMILIEILSTLGNPANASVYLLLDTAMNTPRFLALGLVIGWLYGQQKGKVYK